VKVLSPILVLAALSHAAPALAQVVFNPAALVQLAGIAPPPPPAVEVPPPAPAHHVYHHHHNLMPAVARPVPPPVVAVLARPVPPVVKPAPAPKALTPVGLVFAPGSAALPANAAAMLKPYCGDTGVVGIDARAPGDASDPSTAMRLSLARALAVRDALAACGVPAQNIIPRADGAVAGQNDDETLLGPEK